MYGLRIKSSKIHQINKNEPTVKPKNKRFFRNQDHGLYCSKPFFSDLSGSCCQFSLTQLLRYHDQPVSGFCLIYCILYEYGYQSTQLSRLERCHRTCVVRKVSCSRPGLPDTSYRSLILSITSSHISIAYGDEKNEVRVKEYSIFQKYLKVTWFLPVVL